jgi:hypothetical protein
VLRVRGDGFGGSPKPGTAIDLLLINPLRQVWIAPAIFQSATRAEPIERGSGWRILGRRMSDGSMHSATTTRSIPNSRKSTTCRL